MKQESRIKSFFLGSYSAAVYSPIPESLWLDKSIRLLELLFKTIVPLPLRVFEAPVFSFCSLLVFYRAAQNRTR